MLPLDETAEIFVSFYFFYFPGALSISCTLAEHGPGDDPLQWLRDSIPGEPGTDYPIFSSVQETSFSCENKVFGGKFEKMMPINMKN